MILAIPSAPWFRWKPYGNTAGSVLGRLSHAGSPPLVLRGRVVRSAKLVVSESQASFTPSPGVLHSVGEIKSGELPVLGEKSKSSKHLSILSRYLDRLYVRIQLNDTINIQASPETTIDFVSAPESSHPVQHGCWD